MKNILTAIRTNEDGARTKAIVAGSITLAVVAFGVYITQKNAAVPVVLIVEEAAETITDAAKA